MNMRFVPRPYNRNEWCVYDREDELIVGYYETRADAVQVAIRLCKQAR